MKKALKKLKAKSTNKFKYFLNILIKIVKVFIQSCIICYSIATAFIIINSILGVHIRFSYYFTVATYAMIGTFALLTIINWKTITKVKLKVSTKTVPTNNKDKSQRRVQRNRRNIS